MLIFSALTMPPFRSVKLRTRRADCAACGSDKQNAKTVEDTDYVAFCGGGQLDWETAGLLPGKTGERMSAQVIWVSLNNSFHFIDDLSFRTYTPDSRTRKDRRCLWMFARCPSSRFAIYLLHIVRAYHLLSCWLADYLSTQDVPLSELLANPSTFFESTLHPPLTSASLVSLDPTTLHGGSPTAKTLIVCVCKRGNDSQLAASALQSIVKERSLANVYEVKDLVGGLRAWSRDVDPNFPVY